ncbi:hypothetical protein HZA26_00865 [Candidatus Nomurabacteria bacterium]|nr:hypothetical protein [Candidatus Nomurabacteria bacterium]
METIEKKIECYFNDLPVIQGELLNEAKNKHISFLVGMFKEGKFSTKKLFEYGVGSLPDDKDRPDVPLSIYFFILSEIKGLPNSVRDLAMDAMVYCENDSSFPTRPLEELLSQYEKNIPLLV